MIGSYSVPLSGMARRNIVRLGGIVPYDNTERNVAAIRYVTSTILDRSQRLCLMKCGDT